ncbi:MAG TPA: histidine kinase [Burkholderiales bacterium]|nr:histidine kinase [Burkholderiales bacterium]
MNTLAAANSMQTDLNFAHTSQSSSATQSRLHLTSRCLSLANAISIAVVVGGGLVLVGWLLDLDLLKSVLPHAVTMKPNTAVGFALLGISLWLQLNEASQSSKADPIRKHASQACAVAAILLGLLVLGEYLFKVDIGIDEILFRETLLATQAPHPGRMAPATALKFVFFGLALLLLNIESRRGYRPSEFLALTGVTISLLAIVGYAYGVQELYATFPYSSVALHTAILFTTFGFGVLLARPDRGLIATITSTHLGGLMARRLLPATLIAPFLIGWLRLKGEHAGLYKTEFGLAMLVTSTIIILTTIAWINARLLNRMDDQRHRVDDQLGISEERLRLAVKGAGIGTWHWDLKTSELVWSDRCIALFGLPARRQPSYEIFLACLHPADHARVDEAVKRALADQSDYNVEYRVVWPDGSEHWIASKGRGYCDADGRPIRMEGIVLDISGQKKADADLLASRRELRLLSANIETLREAERTRIARELHDDLGQQLTSLKLELTTLSAMLPQDNGPPSEKIREMRAMMGSAITSVRRIAADLRPIMLDELGLIPAIEWLSHEFSRRHGVNVALLVDDEELAYNDEAGTALFRMIQEALTNVAKHAKATEVRITINQDEGNCVVIVQDNGIGMPLGAQRKPGCFGLLGMHERVRLLTGALFVDSSPGNGASIKIVLPLRAAQTRMEHT